jgi:2-phosphoglycerate kinase
MEQESFDRIARETLVESNYPSEEQFIDFSEASKIISGENALVILLGGTSGTGKSTLASLLASKLGIATVLSTDSIRHIMRNFIERE